MSIPYIGEIRMLPYMRGAPQGWQVCDGSILPISEYETLYTLLGTTYGGDGNTTFGVPDLRGRVPVHQGTGRQTTPVTLGQIGGSESVTLNTGQIGQHVHLMLASSNPGSSTTPAGAVLATVPAAVNENFYATAPSQQESAVFPASMLQPGGGGQPHDNTAPTLTVQYCISLEGLWPAQA